MASNNTKTTSPVSGWPMKILAIALALLLVFGIVWSVVENSGVMQRTTVTIKSEHYSVDNAMLKYFYQTEYANFLNENYYYLQYLGLNTQQSLKTQIYSGKTTWFEYFLGQAITSAKDTMILCEAALKDGRELGEDQIKDRDSAIQTIKDNAKANKMTVDAYLANMYGTGVKLKDVTKCIEMSALAQAQYNYMIESYEWAEQDYNKWIEEKDNLSSIWFADYMSFKFTAEFDKDDDDETKSLARKEAEDLAKSLAEKKTKKEFFDWIVDYEKKLQAEKDKDKEEEDKQEVTYEEEDYTTEGYGYEVEKDLGKWIFDKDRAENDTTVIYDKDNETYTAYIVLQAKYRHEYNTVNVRHILISCTATDENSETYKEAKKTADDLLAEYLKGEKTAEAFGKLAKEHTADGNGDEGGLYENVAKGQMVTEFNDWIYDEARKEGDTGVVKTSYGFHVMYYQGAGMIAWQLTAENGLTADQYEKDFEEMGKTHKVDIDYDNAYKMEE